MEPEALEEEKVLTRSILVFFIFFLSLRSTSLQFACRSPLLSFLALVDTAASAVRPGEYGRASLVITFLESFYSGYFTICFLRWGGPPCSGGQA